jgi:hypothetical protein
MKATGHVTSDKKVKPHFLASLGEMSCVSFNCRGAGNNPTMRELATISQVWSPHLY